MRKTTFIFAGIISAVIGTAYAAGENTVTSKSYVDAQDALKQNKITSKTSGNVVTYNGTDANGQTQFDERGIFDYDTGFDYENDVIVEGREGDLVTAGDVIDRIEAMNSEVTTLANASVVKTTELVCYNPPACTLWRQERKGVLGLECRIDSDCECDPGIPHCVNNLCECEGY